MTEKIFFTIAMKYYRNYETYIKYYIDNIQTFYKDSYILIVDNNSKYIEDIIYLLKDYKNLKIIINNSQCKFEIGAYNEGIRYLQDNNLINEYDFFVFSQDNFVIKNKYDFNLLLDGNILACSFNKFEKESITCPFKNDSRYINILKKINVYDKTNEFNLCWCHSFILHNSVVNKYYDITKDEVIISRSDGSEQSERYLSGILYYLNNYKYVSICGEIENTNILGYDCWKVDIENDSLSNFFVKRVQQKNENTKDE